MTFKQPNRTRRHSGIALIIVLLVITVLAILAGGFAYSMKVETQLARNASFDDELFWLAWGRARKGEVHFGAGSAGTLRTV
jgi:type II secretory pathway component PulK